MKQLTLGVYRKKDNIDPPLGRYFVSDGIETGEFEIETDFTWDSFYWPKETVLMGPILEHVELMQL